jgi:hypothetical protein
MRFHSNAIIAGEYSWTNLYKFFSQNVIAVPVIQQMLNGNFFFCIRQGMANNLSILSTLIASAESFE